ncbi:hypothetical protein GCM10009416_49130 [Craurococcus roseus]|uniref:glycerophosphodiester phosphodiesterase n=1 Tax=Craurococcus roseus TaxID=77585 RepID=A0ABP3RAL4_9PROT
MANRFDTLSGEAPLVIGHRGASAYLPEHTLEAYRLAIQLGADVVEPDVVPTKDGRLIARHENELSGTTDVSARPEFADRRTTKAIDGQEVTGWFSEDFTLAEIKTLYAKERIPEIRPGNTAYDGLYRVPTLEEVMALAQLLGGSYDIAFNLDPANAPLGGDVNAYAGFNYPLRPESAAKGDLQAPAALQAMADLYAEAIGPFKDYILPTVAQRPPVDGDGDGRAQIARRLTGETTQLVEDAHAAGLEVIPYTLRDEEAFQALRPDGSVRPPEEEYRQLIETGIDGFFTDSPDTGRILVNILSNEPAPAEPLEPEFLGEAVAPYGTGFGGLRIGGLSALAYDAGSDAFLALSDDRSPQARFFTVRLDLSDGALSTGDESFTGVQVLADGAGRPFADGALDPEGLALAADGSLYLASEGGRERAGPAARRRLHRLRRADGFAAGGRRLPAHRRPGLGRPRQPRLRGADPVPGRAEPLRRDGERAAPGRAGGEPHHRFAVPRRRVRHRHGPAGGRVHLPHGAGAGRALARRRLRHQRLGGIAGPRRPGDAAGARAVLLHRRRQ